MKCWIISLINRENISNVLLYISFDYKMKALFMTLEAYIGIEMWSFIYNVNLKYDNENGLHNNLLQIDFYNYKLDFVFNLTELYGQVQRVDSGTGNYRSVWRQTHYENNNVSIEGLDTYYH